MQGGETLRGSSIYTFPHGVRTASATPGR